MSQLASERQRDFLRNLVKQKVGQKDLLEAWLATLTSKEASAEIDRLLKLPNLPKAVVEIGIYQNEKGDIYRVQPSKQGGGRYAKKLLFTGGWEYEQGAIYKLKPEQKLTLEQAKAFGTATGLCCVCGAFLTDPKSVAEGIGPVCAKRV